jgi:hypothetical protein
MDAYRSYQAAAALKSGRLTTESERRSGWALLRERRARATWALANGGEESVAFALQMLRSTDLDERADARLIFCQMGCIDQLVDSLIASLCRATDSESVADLTVALGEMRNSRAIPVLRSVLDSGVADTGTKCLAVASLGMLAQRRFDRSDDPEKAARAWLDANGHRTGFPPLDLAPERIISTA